MQTQDTFDIAKALNQAEGHQTPTTPDCARDMAKEAEMTRKQYETNPVEKRAKEQYGTAAAAEYLGYESPDTLRNARHIGKLAGVTAPRYRKIGNRVFYERAALDEWLSQFQEQTCTTGAAA